MSTIRATPGPLDRPQPQCNPFFYGWRDVVTTDEQGRRRLEQQPLTRDDVLHPREGDHIVQNTDHDDDCDYLRDVIKDRTGDQPGTLVAHDLGVNWDVPGLGGHCPDLTLFRGVRDAQRRWDSFNVAEEGVRPELIIEVTSPSTRDVDLNDKRREYFRAGVPVYVILDEFFQRGQRRLRIIPYRRGPRAYRRQRLDARGWFWLEAVQLWLGQQNGRAALYDPQGNYVAGYAEMAEGRQQAEQRATQAQQQATQAEQRATQAQQQATQAEQRATQAQQQATQAEQRATQAQQRAARLAELGRKARRGQASPEELLELESLEQSLPPP